MCVFDTINKFLETVLHQLHKSIYTYLIQNKKKAAVLLILYQRFILKLNRRHFPSLPFTSSQINFCNSPLVYRFYTQQKYKAYKTSLWTSIYTIFRIKNSIIGFVKNSLQISWNIAKRDWVKTHCLLSLKDYVHLSKSNPHCRSCTDLRLDANLVPQFFRNFLR